MFIEEKRSTGREESPSPSRDGFLTLAQLLQRGRSGRSPVCRADMSPTYWPENARKTSLLTFLTNGDAQFNNTEEYTGWTSVELVCPVKLYDGADP